MKKNIIQLVLIHLFILNINAQEFKFEYHEIGNHGNRMGQTSLTDIDNDGDLDWVYGCSGNMFWYEYQEVDTWVNHKLGEGAKTDVGGCPIDINTDGWIDFIVGDSWYQNTGNPGEEIFILHKNTGTISCHDDIAVDVDGDHTLDIVANSDDSAHPFLIWYKIPEDPTKTWLATKIGDGIHGGISPLGYGDLDNDNDMDIVRGDAWFDNIDGRGEQWKQNMVLIPEGVAVRINTD